MSCCGILSRYLYICDIIYLILIIFSSSVPGIRGIRGVLGGGQEIAGHPDPGGDCLTWWSGPTSPVSWRGSSKWTRVDDKGQEKTVGRDGGAAGKAG